jgi:hypothetical protein
MKQPFITTIKTSGTGLWSRASKPVDITALWLSIGGDDEDEWGELKVYFNKKTWDTQTVGLVYTDQPFADALILKLNALGLAGDDIDYSEQGMQGRDYISFDVGQKFIDSWKKAGYSFVDYRE